MGVVRVVVAAAAALLALPAAAQEWGFRPGGTARAEFTDNYSLRAFNEEAGMILSVAPFVVGYRRTETSQINLLAGLGFNTVVGPDVDDYWTGRLVLDGSRTIERSSFGFNLGAYRDTTLRSETPQTGTVLGAAVRTGITGGLSYNYQLTERWNVGTFASAYSNSYSQIQSQPVTTAGALVDNDGWSVGGNVGYAWSQRTQLSLTGSYSTYNSDITDSTYVTTTLAVSHQFSEKLTASAYGGYFWSDIQTTSNVAVCPTTPILCQLGLVQFVLVPFGTDQSSGGTLFGGSLGYQFTERTSLTVGASQNIIPSGTGIINKSTNINGTLSHAFSDRLRGRLGATWTRSTVPGLDTESFRNEYLSFVVGGTYDLAQAWLLDFGYRRDSSDQRGLTGDANVLFVQIAYNWPGQSINDWGFGGFAFPGAVPGAGAPPGVIPGQPMGAPPPVPRSVEESAPKTGGEQ
jgi:hypothetical protein